MRFARHVGADFTAWQRIMPEPAVAIGPCERPSPACRQRCDLRGATPVGTDYKRAASPSAIVAHSACRLFRIGTGGFDGAASRGLFEDRTPRQTQNTDMSNRRIASQFLLPACCVELWNMSKKVFVIWIRSARASCGKRERTFVGTMALSQFLTAQRWPAWPCFSVLTTRRSRAAATESRNQFCPRRN